MSWLQVTIELRDREAARYEAALLALDALSIEYRDGANQPIFEPGPGELPLWHDLNLVALLPADIDASRVRQIVRAAALPDPPPEITVHRLEDRNWLAEWRASLEPRRFGERLWVCPHGQPPPVEDACTVWLDPGLAFGTGSHPTTAMCLEWISKHCKGGSLLDYGCGSGILGLAALALGADCVVAIDNDPQARDACRANLARNQAQGEMLVAAPGDLDTDQAFDAIVANILSGTLNDLAPHLAGHVRDGTRIALTGILPEQAESVRQAYAPWFARLALQEREGWVLLHGISTE